MTRREHWYDCWTFPFLIVDIDLMPVHKKAKPLALQHYCIIKLLAFLGWPHGLDRLLTSNWAHMTDMALNFLIFPGDSGRSLCWKMFFYGKRFIWNQVPGLPQPFKTRCHTGSADQM